MRIGIDCRYILDYKHGERAGIGHYVYYLIKYLLSLDNENEYYLFFYNRQIQCEEFAVNKKVKCVYFPGLENLSKLPFFYRHVFIPHILRLYRLDVYHNPAFIIPLFYFHQSVITVHDLASYKNPKWFPGGNWFGRHILIPLSFYKAKKIVAVSENTKNDLVDIFKIKKEKIEVILEGVEDYTDYQINENAVNQNCKIDNPFFLYLGTLEPRKNLVNLVAAFADFVRQKPEFRLVLAGKKGWKYQPIFDKIKELNLEDKVIYLGYVNHDEKIYLLKRAFAFVFPSYYEGFGLPILEAMNLGLPIITSNVSSIPEIVIDNALLIKTDDYKSITRAMLKLVTDDNLRSELARKGKGIARNFTWESCAKKTLDLYKSLK